MTQVNMQTVRNAKLFGDLLTHLEDVSILLVTQRDELLEKTHENNSDMYTTSAEEVIAMLERNQELECEFRNLLIAEVDRLHEETQTEALVFTNCRKKNKNAINDLERSGNYV
ncbi:hypothetical protein CN899_08120 [Bacillus thuringiensis]|uniref:Uncharacterized protein n=1 Tax=Bacillus thuringiensis TaxID=1428 RepID=A0A9X7C1T4_BACTU|nr:hypothetical protein [Bacillus thuringiensis]PGH85792.1 hypothetical protein CN899_08120 [Bacillus thuringiensis]